jgi:phosphoribosylanthranilate isomerase
MPRASDPHPNPLPEGEGTGALPPPPVEATGHLPLPLGEGRGEGIGPPRAKICGLRTLEAARAAAAGGADYLGFNFYPPARRSIAPEAAAEIIRALRAEGAAAKMVGLFVNAGASEIAEVAAIAGLDIVQLSGHEPPDALAGLRLPTMKTIHVGAGDDPATLLARLDAYLAATAHLPPWPHGERITFLLDAAVPGQYGGTGQAADWSLAAQVAAVRPCGLAGGLTPANVAAAIAQVRPWLVDVSSGVETDGAKDPAKINGFLATVHASRTLSPCEAPQGRRGV